MKFNSINSIPKKIFPLKLKISKIGKGFLTSQDLNSAGINKNDIKLLVDGNILKKIKNGLYLNSTIQNDKLCKTAFMVPFIDGKKVYVTGLSALELGQSNEYVTYGSEYNIKNMPVEIDDSTKIELLVNKVGFSPDTMKTQLDGIDVTIATREQAILDFLDIKTSIVGSFDKFLAFIDKNKNSVNWGNLERLAIKNDQYESLARIGYVLETVLNYQSIDFENWKNYVKTKIKSKIKLDYSNESNKGTYMNDWMIKNNRNDNVFIINKREFNNIPTHFISKSIAIKTNQRLNSFINSESKINFKLLERADVLKELLMYESYFNNLVEGTIFTIEEMMEIMKFGKIGNKHPKEDIYDITKYNEIYSDFLNGKLKLKNYSIIELINYVNKKFCDMKYPKTSDTPAGIFRCDVEKPYQVYVGSINGGYVPPTPDELKILKNFFESEFNGIRNPFLKAVFAHFFIAEMHPFRDGNGRTARLVQNLILLDNGYLPIFCTPQNKNSLYSKALNDLTRSGNAEKFAEYVEKGYAIGKSIYSADGLRQLLKIVKNEFAEDDQFVKRGDVDIEKIIEKYYT